MATEIRVPNLGESIVEATVGQWFKQAGDTVSAAEPLVELETDKVTVEVPAPASGACGALALAHPCANSTQCDGRGAKSTARARKFFRFRSFRLF